LVKNQLRTEIVNEMDDYCPGSQPYHYKAKLFY